ncbi:sigma-70 family RNA polymerase sigma factor [Streptomyces sp. NBC_00893]|uniref:sigma-70 family RNA polymerase sigma factor n=1 Tax=Streptomyces sp. NBC_00893 TaxID=2975862 RepID=UPI002250B3D7|nr:sigma-70 family RNA polymerase sigma factor [Streptomyces sp. NBC_00893]MCX4850247.1 sigma-70 family RNA polymerase sigma factor [Streptomyces sp. NBC_00893]
MNECDGLAEHFEAQRGRLQAVAHRLLGSPNEAEDAVQEAWLRLGRTDVSTVDNLAGWLRTVVTRICLDMLRARTARREDLAEQQVLDEISEPAQGSQPEDGALLADSVSRALLVVLDALEPAERVAFVLHDMFAVPFGQIAPILERTPVATKKLASRARHKVRGTPAVPADELARHRQVVSAFLSAARAGDLNAILAVLAPDVVRRSDPAVLPPGAAAELRGARAVAKGTALLAHRSQLAELALVDGTVGLVVAPRGRLLIALTFTIEKDRIAAYEVIADPARLRRLDLAVLAE